MEICTARHLMYRQLNQQRCVAGMLSPLSQTFAAKILIHLTSLFDLEVSLLKLEAVRMGFTVRG